MPKRTYQPQKSRRRRIHGFLKRSRSNTGRSLLNRRRRKQRRQLAASSPRPKS